MFQLSVILIHPNRLFSDGLTKICENGRYKLVYAGASYEHSHNDSPATVENSVFIVGGHDGSERVRALRASHPKSIILFIGEDGKDDEIARALEAGATCYLRETVSGDLLLKTLDILTHNEVVLCSGFACQKALLDEQPASSTLSAPAISANGAAFESAAGAAFEKPGHLNGSETHLPDGKRTWPPGLQLSAQEAVILRGLVEGFPNKTIANRLHITEATVKVHVKAILRKVRAKNRTLAAIWAIRHLTTLNPETSAQQSFPRNGGVRQL